MFDNLKQLELKLRGTDAFQDSSEGVYYDLHYNGYTVCNRDTAELIGGYVGKGLTLWAGGVHSPFCQIILLELSYLGLSKKKRLTNNND